MKDCLFLSVMSRECGETEKRGVLVMTMVGEDGIYECTRAAKKYGRVDLRRYIGGGMETIKQHDHQTPMVGVEVV